jgi:hypothetical protein
MLGVASNGNDLVAVGKEDKDGEHRALVWTSADGETWLRTATGPFAGDYIDMQQQMGGVVWTGSIFVAYGWDARNFNGFGAAFWTSQEGATWERATVDGSIGHSDPGDTEYVE